MYAGAEEGPEEPSLDRHEFSRRSESRAGEAGWGEEIANEGESLASPAAPSSSGRDAGGPESSPPQTSVGKDALVCPKPLGGSGDEESARVAIGGGGGASPRAKSPGGGRASPRPRSPHLGKVHPTIVIDDPSQPNGHHNPTVNGPLSMDLESEGSRTTKLAGFPSPKKSNLKQPDGHASADTTPQLPSNVHAASPILSRVSSAASSKGTPRPTSARTLDFLSGFRVSALGSRGGGRAWRAGVRSILLTPERRMEREATAEMRRSLRRRRVRFRLDERKGFSAPLLEPSSLFIQRWKAFMVIPFIYEHWAFPFRLALETPSARSSLFVVDVLADGFMVLDLCVQLWTMVPLKSAQQAPAEAARHLDEEAKWVDTFAGVWKHYFTRVFPVEIMPAALYYTATILFQDTSTPKSHATVSWDLWVWWGSTLGRFLPRTRRLMMWWERDLKTNLDVHLKVLQVLQFTFIIFMACHWVGCFFWWIARINSLNDTTWTSYLESTVPLYDRFDVDIATHYIICLYRGVNAMTSLGLSLSFPNTWIELLFCLFVMILQVWLSGLILGTLFHYLGQKDLVTEMHKQLVEDLTAFCEQKLLPPELRERILKHVEFQHRKRVENKSAGSLTLPLSLAVKVANVKYREIMDMCTARNQFLCGCNPQFISALMLKFKIHYLMLGEEIAKKDDASRELVFVFNGAAHVMDDDRVKRVIRSDVPGTAPILAPEVFFFGLKQPHTIRARLDGDVQVLVISREVLEELFVSYPEEQELIISNLLASYGLDSYGRDVVGGASGEGGDDPDQALLKTAIVSALRRRVAQMSSSLGHAASEGDVEEVRKLLRQGADINFADYDGRTVLHTSCAQGNYKVAEVLLENGAERNVRNRWGQTPLAEAIEHHQTAVVELLVHWKAVLDVQNAVGKLCDAASQGDILQVRQLVENGVDPNVGDYDQRTAMHLAAAENKENVVEFLISRKADINSRDRWGGTPLQDAITQGNMILASMIRSKGGEMPAEAGATRVCTAAGEGDVRTVRLLHECGVSVEIGDYDDRFPMHLAAAEARVLVVSFLLGISASPNCKDRWGATPLDDALRGGTPYHMYCAKLIAGWGGKLGVLAGTAEGKRLVKEMDQVDIEDVRALIKRLIAAGYDKRTPNRPSEREMMASFESTLELVQHADAFRAQMDEAADRMGGSLSSMRNFHSEVRMNLAPLCRVLDNDPRRQKRRAAQKHFDNTQAAPDSSLVPQNFLKAATSFKGAVSKARANEKASSSWESGDNQSTAITVPKAPTSLLDLARAGMEMAKAGAFGSHMLEQALAQVFETDEMGALANNLLNLDSGYPVDSDEELQLHAELDALVEVQEKMDAIGMDLHKYIATVFQKYALRITELERAYGILTSVFASVRQEDSGEEGTPAKPRTRELMLEELCDACRIISTKLPKDDMIESMLEDSLASNAAASDLSGGLGPIGMTASDGFGWYEHISLLGASSSFRNFLLNIPTNDMYCMLLATRLSQALNDSQLRLVAASAKQISARENDHIIAPAAKTQGSANGSSFIMRTSSQLNLAAGAESAMWYVLLTGQAVMTPVLPPAEAAPSTTSQRSSSARDPTIIGTGDIFGVHATLQETKASITVRAVTACTLIGIPIEEAEMLLQVDPVGAQVLRTICAENVFHGPAGAEPDISISRHSVISAGTPALEVKTLGSATFNVFEQLAKVAGNGSSPRPAGNGSIDPRPSVSSPVARSSEMRTASISSPVRSLEMSEKSMSLQPAAPKHDGPKTPSAKLMVAAVAGTLGARARMLSSDSYGSVGSVRRFGSMTEVSMEVGAERERLKQWEEASALGDDSVRPDMRSPMQSGAASPAPGGFDSSGMLRVGSSPMHKENLSDLERYAIKSAFKMVQESWNYISMGGGSISYSQLVSLERHMGEAGSQLFKELFSGLDPNEAVTENAFWHCWAKFLAKAETDGEFKLTETSDDALAASKVRSVDESLHGVPEGASEDVFNAEIEDEPQSLFERVHAAISPSRSIKHLLFSDAAAERYEDAYLKVVSDLKVPITANLLPKFVENLLPEYQYRVSARNVREVINAFGRDNQKGKARGTILFSGIRKGFEDFKKRQADDETDIFIGSALNSSSWIYRKWLRFVGILAAYHFLMVPARISFAPWNSYWDVGALAVDLPADLFTMLHAVIVLNTAYKTRNGRWITDRTRISAKAPWLVLVAAVPLDWFAISAGVSMVICDWLRVTKLTLLVWTLRKSFDGQARTLTTWKRVQNLASVSAAVIHLLCCGWFYIGSNYRLWYPDRAISWYEVDEDLEELTFAHNLWGMGEDSSVLERYLLSFYWVASVTTANPMLGSVLPQNTIEILYSICVMTVNLTLFRYVTGEVSALVMRADEELAQSRSHLEGVDAFVRSNALPKELQDEIRGYSVQQSNSTALKGSTLLDGLSHALRVDVANHTCREHLEGVELFSGVSESLLDSLGVLLVEESFEPEEYLYRQHEVATNMFIIVSGGVDELTESATAEEVTQQLRAGQATADVPFFFKMRHWQSAKASRTLGAVVLRFHRDRLSNLLKMFPKEEEAIAQNAMELFSSLRDAATHRTKSSVHQSSVGSSKNKSSGNFSGGGEDESGDGDEGVDSSVGESDVFNVMVGGGLKAKIAAMSERRRADAIHVLCAAAASGEVENLKALLEASTRPQDHDALKRTPLHVAASEGNAPAVRLLLRMNADPTVKDAFQNTPLNDAVRGKHDEAAAVIRCWDPDAPEPDEADKKKKALRDQASSAAKPDNDKPSQEMINRVELPGAQGGVEMCEAASVGDKDAVLRLIRNGVATTEADYDKRTALHLASCGGHTSVVEILLKNNADATQKDRFGWNALDDAVRHGHTAVQRILRATGAKLSADEMGVRMCQAAADGDADTLRVLIVNGVHPSTADYDARTALHLAASNGNITILDLLLGIEGGIEVNPVDRIGGTPLEDAYRHGQKVAIQMLQDAGGLRVGDNRLVELKEAQAMELEKTNKAGREDMVLESVESSLERREMVDVNQRLEGVWKAMSSINSAMLDVQEILVTPDAGWRFLDGTEDERRRSSAISHEFLNDVEAASKMLSEHVIVVHKLLHEERNLTKISKLCRRTYDQTVAEVESELLTAFKLCRFLGKVAREGRRVLDSRKVTWTHSSRIKKQSRWSGVSRAVKLMGASGFRQKMMNTFATNVQDAGATVEDVKAPDPFSKKTPPAGGLVRALTEKNLQASVAKGQANKRLHRNQSATQMLSGVNLLD